MNDRQGKLLLLAATVLIAMQLYPPFVWPAGKNAGYACLVFPPRIIVERDESYTACVNSSLLAIQELVAAAAFAAVYFYLGRKRNT